MDRLNFIRHSRELGFEVEMIRERIIARPSTGTGAECCPSLVSCAVAIGKKIKAARIEAVEKENRRSPAVS